MQRVEIHKEEERDFPGGPESACQCRGHRFDLWSGKIAHTAGQLSFCVTPLSPHILKPVLGIRRGHCSEKPVHYSENTALSCLN